MSKSHNKQTHNDLNEELSDMEFNSEETGNDFDHSETGDPAGSSTDNLAEHLEAEKKQNEELKDSYLRLMAEYDNYRKRTLREKADLIKSAGESVLSGLLPVIDDFERGLSVMQTSGESNENLEGVELIYNKFMSFLNAQGVKSIETIGKDFDTEYHEAVTTIPAASPELKGKIVDCIQKGYTLNDKVIRFAKVVVGE